MKYSTLVSSALMAFTVFAGTQARAADNMASVVITPATGVATLTPRWAIGANQAGFHHMSQDLGLTGSVANNFYSIKSTTIPSGGDILAFNFYVAGSGSATPHADIGSKLTPDSYSALTSADPDVGFGSVNLYLIHHKGTTDYFTAIIPGSASSSAVTDEKPMSGPGGPGTVTGVSGYFGLTFAAANLGYGLNNFYYLRTDPVTHTTKFGTLAPALLGSSADQFDLGTGGHKALAFTGTDVGYGVNKMYYLRLDPVTGFTILGMLDPALAGARHTSDIANLGSVFSTLTFEANDLGFGATTFYTTGTINSTWQSVSFAAIPDRAIAAGSFTVTPSASSGLPITLSVVAGSVGSATISAPVGGVFTITPTQPGILTLQATQVGAVNPIPYESNMLRQSFTVTGVGYPVITNTPLTAAGTIGTSFSFTIAASNSPTTYTATPLPLGLAFNAATGAITGTPTAVGVTSVLLGATNASGTGNATLTITVAAAGVAPIITNSPLTAAGTVGTAFSFTITASGTPTSYTATPLPAGLAINAATGAITGTPTTVGVTSVLLGATNGTGTGNATLTITVVAAGVAPVITNSPLTAAGTVGTAFGFTITASGTPTSYTASPLPAGLSIVAATGAITGTPTTVGVTSVLLGATNGTGTGSATLTITVVAAGVAPIITNSPLTAAGTVGSAFGFTITASGVPTTYTASPLPAGLSIVAATGAITGTPTTVGVTSVLLGATNGSGTGNATLTITVVAAGVAPIITNSPLTAAGTVGTAFGFTITASGLPTTYTASPLPAGLSIVAATGVITGTPTAVGVTTVALGATNGSGTGNATLTITVAAAGVAPIITNSPLTAAGTVGTAFGFAITASGLPTSYAATGLPAGLSIVAATGAITGTPTTAGVTTVALSATNGSGTGNATLTITVATAGVAPIITSAITAPGTVGSPFITYQIVATNLPTSYAATGLPAGLTLNTLTGAITGTPTAAGVAVVPINARNSAGTGTATLTITVAAAGVAPIITSATTTSGAVGTVFVTYQIVSTGLPTSFSATGLPAGLAVNSLTGAINGTPTAAGTSVATIKATNGAGTGSAVLTITVAAASATPILTSAPTASGTVGVPFVTYQIMATGNPTNFTAGGLPPGLVVNSLTGRITGTPTATGNYSTSVSATTGVGAGIGSVIISIAPGIVTQPAGAAVASGGGATFSVVADTGGNSVTYQWRKDGVALSGATNSTLVISNVQAKDVGYYSVVITSFGTSTTSTPALLAFTFAGQVAGNATVVGAGIRHPNGNIYDQVLLTGTSASIKAVAGQLVRISYIDLTDDIVQVEFSGPGTLTINLENSSGPAVALKYNQPDVSYMKGHATIAIAGANDGSNLSIFSVGTLTAVNQGLFRAGTTYDGWADIALVTVGTSDGHFGGVRTANASYFHSTGITGIYAPGVLFSGPVYAGDIDGALTASAVMVLGSTADARITGGDLFQDNGGSIEVSGMTRLQFTSGTSSGGVLILPQTNRGRLTTNGVDVTAQLVP